MSTAGSSKKLPPPKTQWELMQEKWEKEAKRKKEREERRRRKREEKKRKRRDQELS